MSFLKYFIIPLSLLSAVPNVSASEEDNKQLQSGTLTVSPQDLNILNISFNVPLASVLSFDHEPQTQAQAEEYSNFLGTFTQKLFVSQDLFQFKSKGGCNLKSFNHFSNFDKSPASINFDIQYDCKDPNNIKGLALNAFNSFPGITNVKAQYINGDKTVNTVLDKNSSTLMFDDNL